MNISLYTFFPVRTVIWNGTFQNCHSERQFGLSEKPLRTELWNDNLDSLRNLLKLQQFGFSDVGNLSERPFRIIRFSKRFHV
ncbi:hypothetical protein RCL_jg5608.t1 [Rhizophagus clarus]|uniref:Uncharacterized protein n=1 Tax=Rhizophagus clarus TaxID=94130 RepID=A0A8H3R0W6_9GLOM|nr:hypothetical protein RCL_jg5608.t1 [Rhizophagus clarus]